MKYWILALSILASAQAFADVGNSADDAGAAVEAEQMEVYDQKAIEQAAKNEAAALEKQTVRLQKEMKRLQSESSTLSTRIGYAQEHYNKVAKLARETEAQSRKLQAQRDKVKAQLDGIKARTEQQASRLKSAEDLEKSLTKEIRDQGRERTQLEARRRAADQKFQRAARNIKKLRAQQRKMSQNNNRLQQKVAGSEERASSVDNSLESEL